MGSNSPIHMRDNQWITLFRRVFNSLDASVTDVSVIYIRLCETRALFSKTIFQLHKTMLHIPVSAVHVRVRVDHEDGRPVEYYEEDLTEDGTREDFKTLLKWKQSKTQLLQSNFIYVLVYVVWRIHKIKYKLRSNYINAIYMYAYNILRYVYWSLYLEKILWKNHHLKWLTETNVLHMTTDPLYPRADTEETFTLKTLKVGICFQYRNEFIGYRIYTT